MATTLPTELAGFVTLPGVGMQTKHQNTPSTDIYPSGSVYWRDNWAVLEPTDGAYNWARIDGFIDTIAAQGRTLDYGAPELNDFVDARWTPQWMLDKGVTVYPSGAVEWDDAELQAYHARFIRAFARRYDGHPDISCMDIRSLGAFGEWHQSNDTSNFPDWDIQEYMIDLHYEVIKQTPITIPMRAPDAESTMYASDLGRCAWRGDSWGHRVGDNESGHHPVFYTPINNQPRVIDSWKVAPIMLEPQVDMSQWAGLWNISMAGVIDDTIAYRATCVHNYNEDVPAEYQTELNRLFMVIGYRPVVTSVTIPDMIAPGRATVVDVELNNKGVAPCYRDYRLAFRLTGVGNELSQVVTVTSIKGLLPGTHSLSAQVTFPVSATGSYNVEMGLILAGTTGRKSAFAVEGTTDGWLPI